MIEKQLNQASLILYNWHLYAKSKQLKKLKILTAQ